jgi:hypothetical protein
MKSDILEGKTKFQKWFIKYGPIYAIPFCLLLATIFAIIME